MTTYSPMMEHYLKTKEENPDCILFYRLGDFYEMFFEDAITVSRELELTLTGKQCGTEERAPMCGVPFHAADTYLTRLVKKGYKVAICEQVEDPKTAKGMVKREVVRIVTPGTNLDSASLDEERNNFLMCICALDHRFGVSFCDISTGEFLVTETEDETQLIEEIKKYSPSEIICNEALFMSKLPILELREKDHIPVSSITSSYFGDDIAYKALLSHFKVSHLSALGLMDFPVGAIAAGAALSYLTDTQKNDLSQIRVLQVYTRGAYLMLDSATRRNLELCETMRDKEKRGSLLWVLDKTKTAMGARMLRQQIEAPMISRDKIEYRLDGVEEFLKNMIDREELREYLSGVYDLERIMTRITYRTANPRDILAFSGSLAPLNGIQMLLKGMKSQVLSDIYKDFDPLEDLYDMVVRSISEDAPISIHEGGIFKEGYSEEVDRLRKAKTEGKQWLLELEAKERENSGIKNLKIKYNKVFGYFFEVTNSYLSMVPEHFIRKQTLTNAERFFTPELKELENTILGSEEKLTRLEADMFRNLLEQLALQVDRIQKTAHLLAKLDMLQSLAMVAEKNHYVRPKINEKGVIDIKGGRHPVVEKVISDGLFVENDTFLDKNKHRLSIITGPNMAGKSTYMRQTALIVLMAQMGSFVPAKKADIGIVDRIFTRVGASDDLASGQSTFMVEMNEVANILKNATRDSLLILDEIGRGTSTFDGLSIAWAVVEHVADTSLLGAKTLFATHYHELTELEGRLSGVNNFCIAVKEDGDDIVFLRKIIPGGADKSYGIAVAKLAGLPDSVIARSHAILDELVQNDLNEIARSITINGDTKEKKNTKQPDEVDLNQISMFDTITDEDIIEELRNVDVKNMTPLDALNKLNELQSRVINRW